MKEMNAYKKMSPEDLQGLLAMRRRGGSKPAGKGKGSYNRNAHKAAARKECNW